MKKITMLLIVLISFAFAQDNFSKITPAPPVDMTDLEIILLKHKEAELDENGLAIPGSFIYSYTVSYKVWNYDENGKRYIDNKTQGNLIPFMLGAEKTGQKNFVDRIWTLALKLLTVPE